MSVASILKVKGGEVVTASAEATVGEVAGLLGQHRIGAVLITGPGGAIEGIVSERDIVAGVAKSGAEVLGRPAGEIMTRDVHVCDPDDSIYEIMNVMTEQRIRHLPVVVEGKLSGIVSIGDVVKQRIAEVEFEADEMKRYISS
jgi:CBS domain-containing protein